VLTKEQISSAQRLHVEHLETSLFLSSNDGKLAVSPLPIQAQYSVVKAIAVEDFDGDAHADVLLLGNDNRAKLKIGKMDANHGVLLSGNGKGNFRYVPQQESGLCVRGDAGSFLSLNGTLYIGICGEATEAYRFWSASKLKDDHVAHVK
jgi:enediyne biosynthesis protein E4